MTFENLVVIYKFDSKDALKVALTDQNLIAYLLNRDGHFRPANEAVNKISLVTTVDRDYMVRKIRQAGDGHK